MSAQDIAEANITCATSEKPPFPRHLMMNRVTGTRRSSLFDRGLRVDTGGRVTERELQSRAQLSNALVEGFRLPPDQSRDDAIWARVAEPEALQSL